MRPFLPSAAVAILAVLALSPSGAVAQSAAQAPIRIGLSLPLTGPDAAFGQGLRAGAEQAVADLNRATGASGRKLALVVADDAGDGKQGLAVARKFAADRVPLVIGPLNAAVAASALPVYEEAGIVAVTVGIAWPALTTRGAWNVFRLGGSDAEQGPIAAGYLLERFRGRRIGLVHDRSTFGRGLVDDVARSLKTNGQAETAFESLGRGDKDLSALVARLKRARIEVVYFGGLAPEAGLLIRSLREAGLAIPLVGSDGLLDKEFAAGAGPGAEGTVMTLAPEPRKLPEPKGAAAKPRSPETDMVAAQGYAAVEILRQAVEQTKSNEGRKVAAFLHGGAPLKTALGEVSFDDKGQTKAPGYQLQVWKKTPDGRIDYAGNVVTP
ncbi:MULTISPECIES: branched-chain amino acid ABC transporter substrate-binding protein [unclassified Methylobacterium]|uniref:branched-chain amino acid ABC transporter substrate-binding protein n=1 Tax=unclassified Methylobacterium TaxID=2615210 RepID=UPI0006FF1AB1|nr:MULTISPECIES: branched-chain amino acid ABC transporter substrate-binding protein [unclassified Methylobacterium]KQO60559.1 amino acid ABC transporter substrate-binding protein [Methylobacterium sp. Leaf86]KQO86358.1 amino acid ABC transporter substrate-binding protein [Methylobacterium sp. Leaf91]